jgi:hypothetical protein
MLEVPTGGVPRSPLFLTHDGSGVPGNLEANELVDIRLRDGTLTFGLPADCVLWSHDVLGAKGSDVVAWRRAPSVVAPEPGLVGFAWVPSAQERNEFVSSEVRKHNHYFKDVSHLDTVDVYRVLQLFNVTDQALGHAIKKLLVAGGRGAGKDTRRDVQEAVDTLERFIEMRDEDCIEKAD